MYNYINQMQNQLLSAFNSYAFNNTTQILLSNLTNEQLREILQAITRQPFYKNLAHMIRVTLFLNISQGIDRSLYMTHYTLISVEEFRNQRRSLVAGHAPSEIMMDALQTYDHLQQKVETLFQEDSELVLSTILDPQLALPPARRSTLAPSCETVYQIVLACQKVNYLQQTSEQNQSDCYQSKINSFHELLAFVSRIAQIQLSAITDPFEHFSELVLRFMVYRNSVLALHQILPFPSLSQTMKHWSSIMEKHYLRANKTFTQIAEHNLRNDLVFGRFTPDLLVQQGYLNEYVQALVDLSIDQNMVAFCAHSKQSFGELYQRFEETLIDNLNNKNYENIKQQMQKWCNFGLKPCTLLKIIESSSFNDLDETQEFKYDYCQRKDSYIENCAKIHGFTDCQENIIVCS